MLGPTADWRSRDLAERSSILEPPHQSQPSHHPVGLYSEKGPTQVRLQNHAVTVLGTPVATKAMAAKLARLVYRMLRYGMQFVDRGAEFYQTRHRQREISSLKRKAASLGFQITQATAP